MQRVAGHRLVTHRVVHEPAAHLVPQAVEQARVAGKGRELHLDGAGGVLVDAVDHPLELVEALAGAGVLGAAALQLDPAAARVGRQVGHDLVQGDGEGDAELAGEGDGLEGEVGRVDERGGPEGEDRVQRARQERVEQPGQEPRVRGPRDGVQLEGEQRRERDPPPVHALLEVAQLGQGVDGEGADAVVAEDVAGAAHHEVARDGALAPAQHVRPQAVVGEPLDVVAERLVGRLHPDVRLGVVGAALVRVHERRQLAVSLLDVADGGVGGHAQDRVEVAGPLELPVGLVDGEEEVGAHDEDVDAAVVLGEAGLARLGSRGPGADGDAIVCALEEAGG